MPARDGPRRKNLVTNVAEKAKSAEVDPQDEKDGSRVELWPVKDTWIEQHRWEGAIGQGRDV